MSKKEVVLQDVEQTLEATQVKRYGRYPAYKDSGVDWLGEVPAGWEVLPIRRRTIRIQTGSTPPTHQEEYYENGTVAWYGPGSFSESIEIGTPAKSINSLSIRDGVARLFSADSVLVVTIGATLGKIAWLSKAASTNQQITALTFNSQIYGKFAAYQLKSIEIMLRSIAPSATLPILDQQEVASILMAFPPIAEQEAIARFLDEKTAKIDGLIAAKRDLLELLKEKRQALITHAVTKGLNPDVAYKDSGVAWLGEVPVGWEVVQLRRHFCVLNGSTPSSGNDNFWDGDIVWITPDDLGSIAKPEIVDSRRKISIDGYISCGTTIAPPGSLVISTRAPIGYVGIAAVQLCTNQGCRTLVLTRALDTKYYYYVLLACGPELASRGRGSTFTELSKSELSSVVITSPPLSEQEAIARYLDDETARLDELSMVVEEAIERLRELRTALISAAVTGKIDVRGEVV